MAASAPGERKGVADRLEDLGRATVRGVDQMGFGASLVLESLFWILLGRRRRQPVRVEPIFSEAMSVGIRAIPIVTMLSATIGIVLALQAIDLLTPYGAQDRATLGIAISAVREMGPLITGIIIAGRSGSALAARLGTMTINQEVDALQVMGVNPVRFLVVPSLVAMTVLVPCLALWAMFVSITAAGAYVTTSLGMTWAAYVDQTLSVLDTGDIWHGVGKATIFGVLIAVVGIVDGASVKGGAEGVGRVTTASVVHAISAIILTDMFFVYAATLT